MITNTKLTILGGAAGQSAGLGKNLTGQNLPGHETAQERIAKLGVKGYARELQMEKLEEEARAHALTDLNLTEDKLNKIAAASPEKYEQIQANIQDYISEYLTREAMAQLQEEAQEKGLPGYQSGMLVNLSV